MDLSDLTFAEGLLLLSLGGVGISSLLKQVVAPKVPRTRLLSAVVFVGCVVLAVLVFGFRWGIVTGAAAFGAVPLAKEGLSRKFGLSRRQKRAPTERDPEGT